MRNAKLLAGGIILDLEHSDNGFYVILKINSSYGSVYGKLMILNLLLAREIAHAMQQLIVEWDPIIRMMICSGTYFRVMSIGIATSWCLIRYARTSSPSLFTLLMNNVSYLSRQTDIHRYSVYTAIRQFQSPLHGKSW